MSYCRTPFVVLLGVLLCLSFTAAAQPNSIDAVRTPFSNTLQTQWLEQVLPEAERFSDKVGTPPVFQGYKKDANDEDVLVGFVFLSADVPPEEKGFAAPIDMLIGMNMEGVITGLKVLNYTESYRYSLGDFVAEPAFHAQFPGKSITDDFRITQDIDGIAGATMTSYGISQGARGAARRVATAYLDYQEIPDEVLAWAANGRAQLETFTWESMLEAGMVKTLSIPMPADQELILTVSYIGDPILGEFLIGDAAYQRADRDSRARLGGKHLILIGVGGSAAPLFRSTMMYVQQGGGEPERIDPNRFVTAGNGDIGAIAGHVNYAGAIVLEDYIDVNQTINILYKPRGSTDFFSVDYNIYPLALALANGEPILSEADIERARIAESNLFVRLWYAPPWGPTPWLEVMILLGILSLVSTAFIRKDATIRWVALTATMLYLGFFKGGFLSVAHITGAISQGPGIFLNNLPMLMIIIFTVVTTLLWGRVFCSSLCPFGAVQDFITRFTPKSWRIKVPQAIHDRALYIKYGILALIIGVAISGSGISVFQYFEPFGTLFFFSSSALLWVILLAILIASVLIERFYCRYVCPLGAALGIAALLAPLRIKRVPQCGICKVCEHACPTGAIRGADIDFKECVRCDVCESKLITKAGSCRHSMEDIARRQKQGNKIPVRSLDSYTVA